MGRRPRGDPCLSRRPGDLPRSTRELSVMRGRRGADASDRRRAIRPRLRPLYQPRPDSASERSMPWPDVVRRIGERDTIWPERRRRSARPGGSALADMRAGLEADRCRRAPTRRLRLRHSVGMGRPPGWVARGRDLAICATSGSRVGLGAPPPWCRRARVAPPSNVRHCPGAHIPSCFSSFWNCRCRSFCAACRSAWSFFWSAMICASVRSARQSWA